MLALLACYHPWPRHASEEQRKEFSAVSQAFARDKSENARLELALLMSLPNASFRDEARLASLLDNAASRNGAPESARRHLLTLLSRLSAERQRQGHALRKSAKKLEAQVKRRAAPAAKSSRSAPTTCRSEATNCRRNWTSCSRSNGNCALRDARPTSR
ncbi:MAG: hypothetical protein MZW92_39050 [Comamonadaceae bacterium]|nr:hypothetical protein [Comamonadaceae bacterium]